MSILSFGQPMLVNHIFSNELKSQCSSDLNMGGPEVNTLVFLSSFGKKCNLISGIPNNKLGDEFLKYLDDSKINTSNVKKIEKDSLGMVFLKGFDIIYQLKDSAFCSLSLNDINISSILNENYDWLHLNCISFVLSNQIDIIINDLIENAVKNNIRISLDLTQITNEDNLGKIWIFIQKYIKNIFLLNISPTNFLSILKLENISEDEDLKLSLLNFSIKFDIKHISMSINKYSKNNYSFKKEYSRYSILVDQEKTYSSLIRKYKPIKSLSENDYFLSSLINEFIDNKTFIGDMLDKSDFYTSQYLNNRYLNSTKNK